MNNIVSRITILILVTAASAFVALGQSTAFTYQGVLEDNGAPANGSYDFEFRLFDQATAGSQLGATIGVTGVNVVDGAFTVSLDFGDEFPGAARWLEIWVGTPPPASAGERLGGLTQLTPRQRIVSVPYAMHSSTSANADNAASADFATNAGNASTADFATNAGNATTADSATTAGTANSANTANTATSATTAATADNALNLGGVAAGQYVVTTDPRLSDARTPTAGSPDYIQNRTTEQASSDFNISGTGKADILDVATQYNFGGSRVLFTESDSTAVGISAGFNSNALGPGNSYFGNAAGDASPNVSRNSFFGSNAGTNATNEIPPTLLGMDPGSINSFFGYSTGFSNTTGSRNSFFGAFSGSALTSGTQNVFVGAYSGLNNVTGSRNTFVGSDSGMGTTAGDNVTLIGYGADAADGLSFATAIGAGAVVSSSDTIQLGRAGGADGVLIPGSVDVSGGAVISGNVNFGGDIFITGEILSGLPAGDGNYIQNRTTEQASTNFNISGTGKADILDAGTQFNLAGSRFAKYDSTLANLTIGLDTGINLTDGQANLFIGPLTGRDTTGGSRNTFMGTASGVLNTSGSDNTFMGYQAGQLNIAGTGNSFFGRSAGLWNTASNNSFFGANSGNSNSSGTGNSFFGYNAGSFNNTASGNSFFGSAAGEENSGGANSYFGADAGRISGNGSRNSVFGADAGEGLEDGFDNSYFGYQSGLNGRGFENSFFGSGSGPVTTGSKNTFIGFGSGTQNVAGSNNSALGANSGVSGPGFSFATAIGAGAVVSSSNTIQLGRADGSDSVLIPGPISAGTFNAIQQFSIGGTRILSNGGTENLFAGEGTGTTGSYNSYFGYLAGRDNTTGDGNAFFGRIAGFQNTTGFSNAFFGLDSGGFNTIGNYNSFFGAKSGLSNTTGSHNTTVGHDSDVGSGNLDYATALGAGAIVSSSNTVLLGRTNGSDDVVMFGNLGIGTDSPGNKFELSVNTAQLTMGGGGCPSGSIVIGFNGTLSGCNNYSIRGRNSTDLMLNRPTGGQVIFRENNGSAQLILHPGGEFEVRQLGSAGSTSLCRNGSSRIATCSSSIRYKNNVENFASGADILRQLRPVTFAWKDSGLLDLGLVAEEVAEIEPLLVTYKNGVVEGVKYDRIGVVLVNVVKKQAEEIAGLKARVSKQEEEIEMMKSALCSENRSLSFCDK